MKGVEGATRTFLAANAAVTLLVLIVTLLTVALAK